jgi:DNA polymerase III subunit delta
LAQLKAHEFEAALARGTIDQPIVVIYWPDRGLVAERAAKLAAASGVALDDDFSVVRLSASDLQGEPGRLIDEARAIGLFGGKRLIWLKNAANEKALLEALDHLADQPPVDCRLIVEAGDLKKGASLRKIAEGSRAALAVPCYADEGRAITSLINEELSAAGLRITSNARQLLSELLGGDRLASRSELQKLILYARGRETVDEDDVLAVIGDAGALSVDDTVDAVLAGNLQGLDHALQRIVASKSPMFLALQACLRQFQFLEAMLAEAETPGRTISAVFQENERKIHFKRRPAIERALRLWDHSSALQAQSRLHAAILESRKRAALDESIQRHALLALCVRAARASRN